MPFTNSTELSRIKLKNLNSTVRPYDEWAFSRLNFTADWLSHLALVIYMFVVNFDALTQASNFRIERRQVVFLCWMQDSKLGSLRHQFASRLNAHSHGWDNNDTKLSSNLNQDEKSLSDLHTIYMTAIPRDCPLTMILRTHKDTKSHTTVNPARSSYTHMRLWIVPSTFAVMACLIFGSNPFSKLLLIYHNHGPMK